MTFLIHGGTTEEGNCSYLLPRAAAAGSNGTNKGQIRQVPVDEFARFLVYKMDVTRSQLSTNTGILVCLVREIWQFKVFTGKEVTPLHEEGNSWQFRAGKRVTNWFLSVHHVEVDPFRLKLQSCHCGNSQCEDKSVIQLNCLIHAMRHKDNQSERLNHLYETKYTKLFW